MDQERRSQREMMQENEKQARTTYTNAQAKAAMSRRDNKACVFKKGKRML